MKYIISVFLAFIVILCVVEAAQPFEAEKLLKIHQLGERSKAHFEARVASASNAAGAKVLYGLDVSQRVTTDQWKCLRGLNYSFAMTRGYRSIGEHDVNATDNINDARSAGISPIDYYIYPCYKCSMSAEEQIVSSVRHMDALGAPYDMIWLDVETPWSDDLKANRVFFESMLSGAARTTAKFGIYSSLYQWRLLFGLDYNVGGSFPLWYARYDFKVSMDEFKPFAGWVKPSIKQYSDKGSACGVAFDINMCYA